MFLTQNRGRRDEIEHSLDIINSYANKMHLIEGGIYDCDDDLTLSHIYDDAFNNASFRFAYSNYSVILKDFKLYCDYIKSLNQEYVVDFNNLGGLISCSPLGVTYKGGTKEMGSWREVYTYLLNKVCSDHYEKFLELINLNKVRSPIIYEDGSNCVTPYELDCGAYVDINKSASGLMNDLKFVLDKLNIQYNEISIKYKKNQEKKKMDRNAPETITKETFDGILLSFSLDTSLSFSSPSTFIYKGEVNTVDTWRDVYIKFIKHVYCDYPDKFLSYIGRSFNDQRSIDLAYQKMERECVAIGKDKQGKELFLLVNYSSNDISKKIKALMAICNIASSDVLIYYKIGEKKIIKRDKKSIPPRSSSPIISSKKAITEAENIQKPEKPENTKLNVNANSLEETKKETKQVTSNDKMSELLEKLFRRGGDYISKKVLYKTAKEERLIIEEETEDSLYEYISENFPYIFKEKKHIWKYEPDYAKDCGGLVVKYAKAHSSLFTRDEIVEYFNDLGLGSGQLSSLLSKGPVLQYDKGKYVLESALDGDYQKTLKEKLDTLMEGMNFVLTKDIAKDFYDKLPRIKNIQWTEFLIEEVLNKHDIGYQPLDIGRNKSETPPVAISRKDVGLDRFSSIIYGEIKKNFHNKVEFEKQEILDFCQKKGFLSNINELSRTLEGDKNFRLLGNGKYRIE